MGHQTISATCSARLYDRDVTMLRFNVLQSACFRSVPLSAASTDGGAWTIAP